jgi:signal transduction histidine kinase
VTLSPSRLVATVVASALGLAALGWAWEASRFGFSPEAGAVRLRADVQRRFGDATRRVDALARRVSHDGQIVQLLAAGSDPSEALFARLLDLAHTGVTIEASATLHVPAGPPGAFKVVAWSDGPADVLPADQLNGPTPLFVAVGAAGLRLVSAMPIEAAGRRVGVVTAEALLSPAPVATTDPQTFRLATSFGPVPVVAADKREGVLTSPFILASAAGVPLLEVGFEPEMLAAGRQAFRRRVVAMSALPVFVLLLPSVGAVLRRRGASDLASWCFWTAILAVIVVAGGAAVAGLASLVGASPPGTRLIWSLTGFALAVAIPVSAWWRRWPRRRPRSAPVRFAAEQLLAGLVLAAAIGFLVEMLRDPLDAAVLARWQLPIFSADVTALAELGATLLIEIALGWTTAAVLAIVAARWTLGWRRVSGWIAALLWVAPTIVLLYTPAPGIPAPGALAAAVAALFGLFAGTIRHNYRHTSQAVRLLLIFGALLLPVVAVYPLSAFSRDRAVRALVQNDYAPATASAQRAEQLHAWLTAAQAAIDRFPDALQGARAAVPGARVESQAAFRVWRRTPLSRDRVTSEIELFGVNRKLVSRFALNVPQFEEAYRTGEETWTGTSCTWDAFAEVKRFGAEERRMLHADRGLCDVEGRITGAVVIHVLPDYRALPFVSSANPYFDVLARPGSAPGSRIPDLQVVVYGWNLKPTFSSSSGRITWPLPAEVDDRLYRSRDPFWTVLTAEGRDYSVYFLNDRAGIYAVGYPRATLFEHLSRLSESFAGVAVVFLVVLAALTIYAPFAAVPRGPGGPLRRLLVEIRTSFYRKLFLFFVLAAIGPVLLFAAAFSAYTMARFRADIESEAAGVVSVARRVFEELSAAGRRPDQEPAPVSDDMLVWIRQVIDQDDNVYQGPDLVATSQRDLYASGVLPTRTPASVYHTIALHRATTFVANDRIGSFQYLVAAAPVPVSGRDAVLTVPLASRQREIEREVEDLSRGVLVGMVVVVLFAAGLGASVAGRVSDPVSRLTRATRLIASGNLDVRLMADTADELGRLVEDFNAMAATLVAQRAELARTHQFKAWAEMARQVAHEIKNPLTPIQLAAEHLRHVHEDSKRPLGPVFDQCVNTVLQQVRLLRQIASEFATFGSETVARPGAVNLASLVEAVVGPYRPGLDGRIRIETAIDARLPGVWVDRTLILRALTNVVENAIQAMPGRGTLTVTAAGRDAEVVVTVSDTGLGMDQEAVRRAFEPYFSTKTAGSGLGLANAKRNIELCGGAIEIGSTPGTGTTVTITLPTEAPARAIAPGTPPGQ